MTSDEIAEQLDKVADLHFWSGEPVDAEQGRVLRDAVESILRHMAEQSAAAGSA